MPKVSAPAPAKAPAKKAPKAPAFTANVGDVVVFKGYEAPNDSPLLVEGEYVRVTEIDKTKKGRVRYHLQPIMGNEDGTARDADTGFGEELSTPTAEQAEEIEALLAHSEEEGEDLAALGEAADAGDEDAQARLTELAGESGVDTEAYASWAEVASALDPDSIPEGEDETETEAGEGEAEGEDIAGLGEAADAGDEEAQARLTELAAEAGVDVEALASWSEVASALAPEAETAAEEEAPAKPAKKTPAKPAGKDGKKPAANSKKASTTPKAPKLTLTPTMERMLAETNNDLLAAMQQTEKQIGQSFLDLGGLVKLGEIQNAHLMDLDPETGKPRFEDSKKGYYQWVAANLETEERVARHLAKIYQVFVAKLKFEPEGLIELGISRLREIAPIALKLAKEDKESNAAKKAVGEAEDSANLEAFLQEAATLTVKDVVAKVRAYKAQGGEEGGEGGNGAGAGAVLGQKVATLTFRLFEDKANYVKTVLEAAVSDLPDAERNMDNALFRIFSEYGSSVGLPEFTPAGAAKAPAKTTAKPAAKTAPAKPAAPAKKTPAKVTAKK